MTKAEKPKPKSDKEQVVELTDSLQRLQAEFENYRKQIDKEKLAFNTYVKGVFIEKILPVLDAFEVAQRNVNNKEEYVKGINLIHAQLLSTLEAEGLKPIDASKKFDPELHEVMFKEKSEKEEGTIIEVLQKGYTLDGKVLRYSKVKIADK